MNEVKEAAKMLLKYIKENDVFDSFCDDGDGYTSEWISEEFKVLINNLEKALEKE